VAVIIDTSDAAKDTETVTDTNIIIEMTSDDTAILVMQLMLRKLFMLLLLMSL